MKDFSEYLKKVEMLNEQEQKQTTAKGKTFEEYLGMIDEGVSGSTTIPKPTSKPSGYTTTEFKTPEEAEKALLDSNKNPGIYLIIKNNNSSYTFQFIGANRKQAQDFKDKNSPKFEKEVIKPEKGFKLKK